MVEGRRPKESEMATQAAEKYETVVIGGGQAGLAAGYHLAQLDGSFVILDASERVGDSWRTRWPSLRLYSPAQYDGLPGMAFPAPRHSYPTAYEMADYLEAYAARYELPVRNGVHVDRLSKNGRGYVVVAGDRRFEAENVVVATGVMQAPVVPGFAADLDPSITQLHSLEYRSPAQLQAGSVLVVGAAHSGGDIAYEVAAEHRTVLSGRDTGQMPFRLESRRMRVVWPVLRFLATRVITVDTPIGRKARHEIRGHGGPLLRVKRSDLAAAGVERVLDRTVGVQDGFPVLENGRVLEVANVIWCTGFRPNYSWIDLPLEYEEGYPSQYRGAVASHPGLYFLGMLFLHSFSSMLVLGAGRDAKRVAKHIAARSKGRAPANEEVLVWNGMVSIVENDAQRAQKVPSSEAATPTRERRGRARTKR
jgi:putative flavoprotein involved in K+ transport